MATENWTPAAGVLNDGDSVTVGITTAAPGGCEYISDPVVVSVSPTPAASLSTPSPRVTICSGASITLDALPAGQATDYTFDIGNGQPVIIQGTEQLITTYIRLNGSYSYCYKCWRLFRCSNTNHNSSTSFHRRRCSYC